MGWPIRAALRGGYCDIPFKKIAGSAGDDVNAVPVRYGVVSFPDPKIKSRVLILGVGSGNGTIEYLSLANHPGPLSPAHHEEKYGRLARLDYDQYSRYMR